MVFKNKFPFQILLCVNMSLKRFDSFMLLDNDFKLCSSQTSPHRIWHEPLHSKRESDTERNILLTQDNLDKYAKLQPPHHIFPRITTCSFAVGGIWFLEGEIAILEQWDNILWFKPLGPVIVRKCTMVKTTDEVFLSKQTYITALKLWHITKS